jgi:hypothetical protein
MAVVEQWPSGNKVDIEEKKAHVQRRKHMYNAFLVGLAARVSRQP